jgi:hypothetical protein
MEEIINKLKANWTIPKTTMDNEAESFFKFACEFDGGIEINDSKIPLELQQFYQISNGAVLFKDVDFGQWGLKIHPYNELNKFNDYTRGWRGEDIEDDDPLQEQVLPELPLPLLDVLLLEEPLKILVMVF